MFNGKTATLCALATLAATALGAEPQRAEVSVQRPIVVELFTSQGCSSCPPADALLGELAREPDVIALAFHVQYWDSLGWSDRFGLPESALRQERYTRQLRLASSFTPQLIVDASASLVGSDRQRIRAALTQLRGASRPTVNLTAAVHDGVLDIELPAAAAPPAGAELLLMPLLPQADSAIGRGENGGHTLREFDIVLAQRILGRWDGRVAHYNVPLASLPPAATRVALLLQARGQGSMLGATLLSLH
jgi:hypothetical protein